MAKIKENLRYLQVSLRYPRNIVAELFKNFKLHALVHGSTFKVVLRVHQI
jgi:hypothetical protein